MTKSIALLTTLLLALAVLWLASGTEAAATPSSAQKTWVEAPECCKGCEYPTSTGCCCARRQRVTRTRTVRPTVTHTLHVTIDAGGRKKIGGASTKSTSRGPASKATGNIAAKISAVQRRGKEVVGGDSFGHLESGLLEPEASYSPAGGTELDLVSEGLFKRQARHLCGMCPVSSPVRNYTQWIKAGGTKQNAGQVGWCCPRAPPPVYKTVTRAVIRTRTVTHTTTRTTTATATIAGRLFEDVNKNGRWDQGVDLPLVRTPIVLTVPTTNKALARLFARGVTIIASGITDGEGRFSFVSTQVKPNLELGVALQSKPEEPIKTITTDTTGNVNAEIPIDVGSNLVSTTQPTSTTCGAQQIKTQTITSTVTLSLGKSISYITACPTWPSGVPTGCPTRTATVETCNMTALTVTVSSSPILQLVPCPCLTSTQTTTTSITSTFTRSSTTSVTFTQNQEQHLTHRDVQQQVQNDHGHVVQSLENQLQSHHLDSIANKDIVFGYGHKDFEQHQQKRDENFVQRLANDHGDEIRHAFVYHRIYKDHVAKHEHFQDSLEHQLDCHQHIPQHVEHQFYPEHLVVDSFEHEPNSYNYEYTDDQLIAHYGDDVNYRDADLEYDLRDGNADIVHFRDRDRNADDVLAFGNELNDNPDFDFAHRVLDQRNRDQYFGNSNFDHKLAYDRDADSYQQFSYGNEFFSFANRDQLFDYGNGNIIEFDNIHDERDGNDVGNGNVDQHQRNSHTVIHQLVSIHEFSIGNHFKFLRNAYADVFQFFGDNQRFRNLELAYEDDVQCQRDNKLGHRHRDDLSFRDKLVGDANRDIVLVYNDFIVSFCFDHEVWNHHRRPDNDVEPNPLDDHDDDSGLLAAGDIVVVGTTASSRYEFYQGPIIIDKIYYPGTNAWIAAVAMDTMARKWTFTFGGDSNDIANSVDTDNSGYAYACGTFYSSQFNMTAYNGSRILYNVGGSDGWLVSLNSSGGIVWAQQIGDAFDDTCDVVKRNPSATAIWVGGSFASEQMDLGNGVILTNSNPGTLNMYLIKYDSSGNAQAAYQYGGIGADTLNDFAFSPDGNYIYIAGRFISPTLNFGNGVVLLRNNTKSGYEGFLVKVSATTGAAQWAYSYSTNATDSADVVAVDTLGNVAVAGQYGGGFNLSIGNVTLTSSGNTDIFIANYEPSGFFRYADRIGGVASEFPTALVSTGNGFMMSGSMAYDGAISNQAYFPGQMVWVTSGGEDQAGKKGFLYAFESENYNPAASSISAFQTSTSVDIYGGYGGETIIQGLYADQWGRVIHVGATHNEIVNHPTQIPGTDPSAWDPTLTGVAGGFEAYISRVYFNGTFPLAFPTSGPP